MGGVISNIFQFVLGVPSKLTLDAINKGLGVSEVFLEESFGIRLHDWSGAVMAVLVLGPSEANNITKKCGGKEGIIYSCGA